MGVKGMKIPLSQWGVNGMKVPAEGMNDSKTTMLHCRIPSELHDKLRAMAQAEGRSIAQMTSRALEAGLVDIDKYELKWVLKE